MDPTIAWLWENVVSPTPPPISSIPSGVVARSMRERLANLLYLRLQESGGWGRLPADEQQLLQRCYGGAMRRTVLVLEAAQEFATALEAKGIVSVLLKGAAHVLTIYQHPAARPMSDLDLLVPAAAFQDAIQCAKALGYRVDAPARPGDTFVDSVALRRGEVMIDLHERLTHSLKQNPDLGPLFARAVSPLCGGDRSSRAFRVLAPEDAALHTVLHKVHHGFTTGLLEFADLVRIVSTPGFRWPLFANEVARWRLTASALVVLRIIERNLGLPVAKNFDGDPWSRVVADVMGHLLDQQDGRLRIGLSPRWSYALVTRPLLDGPLFASVWFIERVLRRLARISYFQRLR